MGVKDWLAGTVAGPKGYGSAMGREARKGGSALANALFISHGTGPSGGQSIILDTPEEMIAAGFKPRSETTFKIVLDSLTDNERALLKNLQVGMISYAFIVNSNGALQNMRRENTSKFRNGLGPAMLQSMVDCGLFSKYEDAQADVLSYIKLMNTISASAVLNMEKPGSGDVLERFIMKSVQTCESTSCYGFTRTGVTGFSFVAIPLVEETLKSIVAATVQYKW